MFDKLYRLRVPVDQRERVGGGADGEKLKTVQCGQTVGKWLLVREGEPVSRAVISLCSVNARS